MSAEQSQEDLKAGGEGKGAAGGERTPAELKNVQNNAAKTESASSSAAAVKPSSATSSVSAIKSASSRGSAQQRGSISSKASLSAKFSKEKIVKSSKTKMATASKVSFEDKAATLSTASLVTSKEKLSRSSKEGANSGVIMEETEEEMEDGEEERQAPSELVVASSSARVPTSDDIKSTQAWEDGIGAESSGLLTLAEPSSSLSEIPLKKAATLARSTVSRAISSKMSSVIASVAMSRAALLTDAVKTASLIKPRSGPGQAQQVAQRQQEAVFRERSVWQDPDVIDILGKMRLDALGENVISSREGSEETLPEGLTTQFDVEDEGKPAEKALNQLMEFKDEIRSIAEDASQIGSSIITNFWPSEFQRPGLQEEEEEGVDIQMQTTSTEDSSPNDVLEPISSKIPSKEASGTEPEPRRSEEAEHEPDQIPAQPPPIPVQSPQEPCDASKLKCFTQKDDISSKELSLSSSYVRTRSDLKLVAQVKFRLSTGQILKRIYRQDVIFLEALDDLSQILDVSPENLQLFFDKVPLNLNTTVRDVSKSRGAEVLIEADIRPEHVFHLVEKGIISFDDDEALDRYLLYQVPRIPKENARHFRPVPVTKAVPQPASFIPSLLDHRKKDGVISSELERQLELTNSVRCIQSSFRCYLSKRTFVRKEHSSQEPIKVSPAEEASCKRNLLMKDVNLLNKEDFTVLYNLLGEWWRGESDTIKRNNSAAAKIARLFNLLLREIGYMRDIEMHRWKLKQRDRVTRIWQLIENIAANHKYREWEYIEECSSLWKRVELLPVLNGAVAERSRRRHPACKLGQHLNCEKCAAVATSNRKAIQDAISRDMNTIIEGKYETGKRDSLCRCYCYTCHRFLPIGMFKVFTKSTRIWSCGKCHGVVNLGRLRRDLTVAKALMEDVRKEEISRRGCSWLPYIMQAEDFVTLANVWHELSALSGASCDLRFVRWEPMEEWSPWNTILLTREEALAHRTDAYSDDFVATVRKRHFTAKRTFRNLINMEKKMEREYGTVARNSNDN